MNPHLGSCCFQIYSSVFCFGVFQFVLTFSDEVESYFVSSSAVALVCDQNLTVLILPH